MLGMDFTDVLRADHDFITKTVVSGIPKATPESPAVSAVLTENGDYFVKALIYIARIWLQILNHLIYREE